MIPSEDAIAKIPVIKSTGFTLFYLLCNIADNKGECSPSYDDIQNVTGFARTTISKFIQVLISNGMITTKKCFNKNMVYTVVQNYYYSSPQVLLMDTNNTINVNEVLPSISSTYELLDEPPSEITPYQRLWDTFINMTYLQPNGLNMPKWNDSIQKMLKSGVTPEIMTIAINDLSERQYTISGPWSIVNACANVMRNKNYIKPKQPETVWAEEWG